MSRTKNLPESSYVNTALAPEELSELFMVNHGYEHYCDKCSACSAVPDFTNVGFATTDKQSPYRVRMKCKVCSKAREVHLDEATWTDFKTFYKVSFS